MTRFFYKDIVLEVSDSVYVPREDSLMLADLLEGEQPCKALDLGCGSGFLAILLTKHGCTVTATDINPAAVADTERNAAINFVQLEAVQSNLFEDVKDVFDLIIFNPPYLPNDAPIDLQWSGGIDVVRRFLLDAKRHLNNNGKILFLISTLTSEKETIDAIEKNGYKYKILARKKVPWEELIVFELRK